jgi:hypothetical protein
MMRIKHRSSLAFLLLTCVQHQIPGAYVAYLSLIISGLRDAEHVHSGKGFNIFPVQDPYVSHTLAALDIKI